MILFHFFLKYLKRNKIAVVIELEPSSFSVQFIMDPFMTTTANKLKVFVIYTDLRIIHISFSQRNFMVNDFSDSTTYFT